MVQAKIRIDGTPTDIQVYKSSGYPLLDTSAVESIKELTFIPAKTDTGKSVESHVVIPIRFELK